jgi:hypothetical protein
MKIMEALAGKNLMLVNGNRWLVLRNGTFTVFEHKFRKVTDVQLYSGTEEETAVRFLVEGAPEAASDQAA